MEYLVGVSLFLGTFVETFFLIGCKFHFYNAFNTVFANYDRYTEADVVFSVLTVLGNAAGNDSLLVVQDGPYDACCACAGA